MLHYLFVMIDFYVLYTVYVSQPFIERARHKGSNNKKKRAANVVNYCKAKYNILTLSIVALPLCFFLET